MAACEDCETKSCCRHTSQRLEGVAHSPNCLFVVVLSDSRWYHALIADVDRDPRTSTNNFDVHRLIALCSHRPMGEKYDEEVEGGGSDDRSAELSYATVLLLFALTEGGQPS